MPETISINPVSESRLFQNQRESLEFGKIFADHMLIADYDDGNWSMPQIVPYGPMSFSPALAALHYGQSVFEGFKAHCSVGGGITLFRPWENLARLNRSAKRLAMPEIPKSLFLDGVAELVRIDRDWIPRGEGESLYVRPVFFAVDENLFVRPAKRYRLAVVTCPTGRYFQKPIRLIAEDNYVRAFPHGTGDVKASGNYAAALLPGCTAQERGFHNVLWLDAVHHSFIEECGVMNIFLVFGSVAMTPLLTGSILPGVTRDSVLTLLNDLQVDTKQRLISMQEVLDADRTGQLTEAFGVGTAATVASIESIHYRGHEIKLPRFGQGSIGARVRRLLQDIQTGREPDRYNWLMQI